MMHNSPFHRAASIAITALLAGLPLLSCSGDGKRAIPADRVRDFANALYNRELYHQAVAEYERYLDQYPQEPREEANITYIIGNIYFERLNDYEAALAYYLKIKHLYPESNLVDSVNKRVVECLERLQRSADAQQALEETTSLDPNQVHKKRPGAVVARIGKREISQGDLEFEIHQLPTYMQSQFSERKRRIEFLKQYIATELLFDTAKRKGLDRDQQVIDGAFQAKKGLMVKKLLEEEIMKEMGEITPQDVELYFKANKEKYAEKDDEGKVKRQKSFEEVREQAAQDLMLERQQQAYDALVQRMMRAEEVQVLEDQVQ